MFVNPTGTLQFRSRAPARAAPAGVPATRVNASAVTRRGAMVRRETGRPVLACRWVAVAGGRLECHWTVEFDDTTSADEPKGNLAEARYRLVP
jgi:hypothetical protein